MRLTDTQELGFELRERPRTKGQDMMHSGVLPRLCTAENGQRRDSFAARESGAAISRLRERVGLGALHRAYGRITVFKGEFDSARDRFGGSLDLFGETGTGREPGFSGFVGWGSQSSDRTHRLKNCSATQDGYAGAGRDKPGLAELSEGGTFCPCEAADTSRAPHSGQFEVHPSREVRRLRENHSRDVGPCLGLPQLHNLNLDRLPVESLFRPDLCHRLRETTMRFPSPRLNGQIKTPV